MLDTFGVLVHTLRVGRCCLTSTIYSTLLHGAFWKNVECVCGDDVEENADFERGKFSDGSKQLRPSYCIVVETLGP